MVTPFKFNNSKLLDNKYRYHNRATFFSGEILLKATAENCNFYFTLDDIIY